MNYFQSSYDQEICTRKGAVPVPEYFNIGVACSDIFLKSKADCPAILEINQDGNHTAISYASLSENSSRFASSLQNIGIETGERVAILLPQGADVAVAHLAIYKLGAIAVPLSHVFQEEAISYRLKDSGASTLVTDDIGFAKLSQILAKEPLPDLKNVILTGNQNNANELNSASLNELIAGGNPAFSPVNTKADDPCLIIYTSGTTGLPKGTLHAHRVLLGHLPGFELHHQPDKAKGVYWTPSDWAWAGGLLNLLFPALYHGQTVIAWPCQKFDPVRAFTMMAKYKVTNAFIPPTALRMMQTVQNIPQLFLKALTSAGESLGSTTYVWCKTHLNVQVDEFYGQTECNYVLGSCARTGLSKPGFIGKPLPGARVTLSRQNNEADGEIIVHYNHPSMFLGYWNQPEATKAKFRGEWMVTGDIASKDHENYIQFIGRNDDVITSSGYRIGPVEIEECLLKHKAVALAAVVGKADGLRTEIVKAYIVLHANFTANDELAADIQSFVRTKLSSHEYPREISFIDALPMTSTGKIMRRLLRTAK